MLRVRVVVGGADSQSWRNSTKFGLLVTNIIRDNKALFKLGPATDVGYLYRRRPMLGGVVCGRMCKLVKAW